MNGLQHFALITGLLILIASFLIFQNALTDRPPPEPQTTPLDSVIPEVPLAPPVPEEVFIPEDSQQEVFVEIKNLQFQPKVITILPGTTVTWINKDELPGSPGRARTHMIKGFAGFRSERLELNQSYSYTFTEVGEYRYIDTIFTKQMEGTVVVSEKALDAVTGNVILNVPSSLGPGTLVMVVFFVSMAGALIVTHRHA
ncbi:hypothetical protein J4464_07030 [Candidatus Woesearchaeota archaeon]|nr:hypothetical protein [Candidatus Woesearchaeota archaeon]